MAPLIWGPHIRLFLIRRLAVPALEQRPHDLTTSDRRFLPSSSLLWDKAPSPTNRPFILGHSIATELLATQCTGFSATVKPWRKSPLSRSPMSRFPGIRDFLTQRAQTGAR